MVFSLVESRRESREEKEIEGGGFNHVCYI